MKTPLLLVAVLGLSISSTLLASTPAPDRQGSVPVLLGLEAVRSDLKLSSAQAQQADAIRTDFRNRARKIVASSGANPESRLAADAKLESLRKSTNAAALAILSPSQKSRLSEIEHQVLGGSLLVSPTVQKQLGLSATQVAAIEKIRKAGLSFSQQVNSDFEAGIISHHDRIELLRSRRLADAEKLMAVLQPEQRRSKLALAGRPLKSI